MEIDPQAEKRSSEINLFLAWTRATIFITGILMLVIYIGILRSNYELVVIAGVASVVWGIATLFCVRFCSHVETEIGWGLVVCGMVLLVDGIMPIIDAITGVWHTSFTTYFSFGTLLIIFMESIVIHYLSKDQ